MSAIPPKEISHTLEVYPNPASGKIKVELDLYAGTPVVMELIDTKGMTIKKIEHAYRAKGKHSWSVDLHNLPAGNYIISVVTIQHHLGEKFQVTH